MIGRQGIENNIDPLEQSMRGGGSRKRV